MDNYQHRDDNEQRTHYNSCDGTSTDKNAVDRNCDEKNVEISIVAAADAVADPRTVMIKAFCSTHNNMTMISDQCQ